MSTRKTLEEIIGRSPEEHKEKYLKKGMHYFTEADFSTYVTDKMKNHKPDRLTNRRIAEIIGYKGEAAKRKAETVKKIIGQEGYTSDRNKIIAICKAIDLNVEETNHALKLYKMLPLDRKDYRESVICFALDYSISFDELNEYLSKSGCEIVSIEKTGKGNSLLKYASKYRIISERSYAYNEFKTFSILDNYRLQNFVCKVELDLEDKEHNKYLFVYWGQGECDVYEVDDNNEARHLYGELDFEENDYLRAEFAEQIFYAETLLTKKWDEVKNYLDDTKYFYTRYYVSSGENELEFYVETFSYDDPFSAEYYQMIKKGGNYKMSVSNESYFLPHVLRKQYKNYYPFKKQENFICEYSERQSIQDKRHQEAYDRLVQTIEEVLEKIKKRQVVLLSPWDIFSDYYWDISAIFGIQDLITWNNKDYEIITPESNEFEFAHEGREFKLSFDILERAIELGIFSIEEICNLIANYGTVEAIIR